MTIALLIAIVVLYSFGHWIGATLLLAVLAFIIAEDVRDPTGIKRFVERFRQ